MSGNALQRLEGVSAELSAVGQGFDGEIDNLVPKYGPKYEYLNTVRRLSSPRCI
jgi:hypothetical protein